MYNHRMVSIPPLGIIPRKIWLAQRLHELSRAIYEYSEGGFEVNPEWINEFNMIVKELCRINGQGTGKKN